MKHRPQDGERGTEGRGRGGSRKMGGGRREGERGSLGLEPKFSHEGRNKRSSWTRSSVQ